MFLNYGASYFDLLSQRIDDNEAEITDVDFAKLDKPDPIVQNGLLYLTNLEGDIASSTVLCQDNNALQNVQCVQIPSSATNPATTIPELAGQADTTLWISSANGHLYRGSVDVESGGGSGNVTSITTSTSNLGVVPTYVGTTGTQIQASPVIITNNALVQNARSYGFQTVSVNPSTNSFWLRDNGIEAPTPMFANDPVGNVSGGIASFDNALARFDGTTGKAIQGSNVKLSDTDELIFPDVALIINDNEDPLLQVSSSTIGICRPSSGNSILLGVAPSGDTYNGIGNIVIGQGSCLNTPITASENVVIGNDCGRLLGVGTVAIGTNISAQPSTTLNGLGSYNTLIGDRVYVTSDASENVVIGNQSSVNGQRSVILGGYCNNASAAGVDNVIMGYEAFSSSSSTANGNVVIGARALVSVQDPSSNNIVIGTDAGSNITGGCSGNIYINNAGVNAETNTTRIGSSKTACYISGITNSNTVNNTRMPVSILSDGRLVSSNSFTGYGYIAALGSQNVVTDGTPYQHIPTLTYTTFSSDGKFTIGSNSGRIKYVGAGTVTVRVNYSYNLTSTVTNNTRLYFAINDVATSAYLTGLNVSISSFTNYTSTGYLPMSSGDELSFYVDPATSSTFTVASFTLEAVIIG